MEPPAGSSEQPRLDRIHSSQRHAAWDPGSCIPIPTRGRPPVAPVWVYPPEGPHSTDRDDGPKGIRVEVEEQGNPRQVEAKIAQRNPPGLRYPPP